MLVPLLALAGCATEGAGASGGHPPPRTVTGTATGKVEGVPDTLTVSLGVQTIGHTAQRALDENSTRATNVINALKAAGVSAADLQTTDLSLSPTYDRYGRITGYGVSNVVTAKTHDVPNGGRIIDAAAAQAGNDIQVQGIQLSIEDTSALVARARAEAVRQAASQARQMARAARVRLGPVQRITERRTPGVLGPTMLRNADAASSAPIEPGTQSLSVDVTVVYAIG
jgi:uncharacterized protein YggE